MVRKRAYDRDLAIVNAVAVQRNHRVGLGQAAKEHHTPALAHDLDRLRLRRGDRIGTDHNVGPQPGRERTHPLVQVLGNRIDDRQRLEPARQRAPHGAPLRDDHPRPPRLGDDDVQAADGAGPDDHHRIPGARAGLVVCCQHRAARLGQGALDKGQLIWHTVHDAIGQHLVRQDHLFGKAARIARVDPQEMQLVAQIVHPAPAVGALAAVDIRGDCQPVSYDIARHLGACRDDHAADLVPRHNVIHTRRRSLAPTAQIRPTHATRLHLDDQAILRHHRLGHLSERERANSCQECGLHDPSPSASDNMCPTAPPGCVWPNASRVYPRRSSSSTHNTSPAAPLTRELPVAIMP